MAVQTVRATINGQTYDLTYNPSTQKYEATITAPTTSSYTKPGHYYPVSVTATDDAGNSATISADSGTFAEDLKLVVKEKVAPVITITAPSTGSTLTTNTPQITWTVTDNDSGVDPDTIKLTIDTTVITSGITKTPTTGGYTCSYTPSVLSDGNHTFKFDASDNDGNVATQKSTTIKIDTVPPTLTLTSPADGLITNNATLTVSGTTNDVTSSPCTVTVKVGSGTPKNVTVESNGSFTTTVTLSNGQNTITVTSTDSAGKSTTVTRTVKLDTGAPVFQSVTITPNPVDAGQTYIISVAVTD